MKYLILALSIAAATGCGDTDKKNNSQKQIKDNGSYIVFHETIMGDCDPDNIEFRYVGGKFLNQETRTYLDAFITGNSFEINQEIEIIDIVEAECDDGVCIDEVTIKEKYNIYGMFSVNEKSIRGSFESEDGECYGIIHGFRI